MEKDDLPTYTSVVEGVSPPGYLASILNEQINPVLNKDWAKSLHDQHVSKEVREVVVSATTQDIPTRDDSDSAQVEIASARDDDNPPSGSTRDRVYRAMRILIH